MTPNDLIDDLRSRINPAYAAQLGTESYERRLCAEAIEALIAENDTLRTRDTCGRQCEGTAYRIELRRLKREMPDLSPVIAWLESGCDPKEAAKELRIYQQRMCSNAGIHRAAEGRPVE